MHMSDALISPAVGGIMWAVSAGAAAYAVRKITGEHTLDDRKIPLAGVMGAFVFAGQMLNFTIPGTGSSGHISGALLLSAMLGPSAGFLTLAVILTVQALFFADGGLLALGCNIFNIGFGTCFIAYPLFFKPFMRTDISKRRLTAASIIAAIAGLQFGAFSVVLETFFSGKAELPFSTFVLFMQPVHLAIGLVEGLITAALLVFLNANAPEAVNGLRSGFTKPVTRKVIVFFAIFALLCGGIFSWFASSHPDGLEWSVAKVTNGGEPEASGAIYSKMEEIQGATAFLPDYGFPSDAEKADEAVWPAVDSGTTVAGITGNVATLILCALAGALLSLIKIKRKKAAEA